MTTKYQKNTEKNYAENTGKLFGEYKKWHYIDDKVGWMKKINKEDLDKFITMKAEKLPKYQRNISDVRLLLVSDRTNNSGRAWLPEESKFKKQGFSEIYYLSYPDSVKKLSS